MVRQIDVRTDEERNADELTKQRLSVNNAADVHFTGRLLHEYSTQNRDGSKPRWTELRVWETAGGAWIAESVGCSDRQGEADLRDVLVIPHPSTRSQVHIELHDGPLVNEPDKIPPPSILNRAEINEVMDFFGWSTVAKAFAKAAGWDVVRRVD